MDALDAAEGFWGKVDSNVNWCEQDYAVSFYIAEFWNTISSLPMIYFGIIGYLAAKNRAKMPMPDGTRRAERHLLAFFLVLSVVGLGSTAFHGTMRFFAQILDEAPMVFGGVLLNWLMLDLPDAPMRWLPWVEFPIVTAATLVYVITHKFYGIFLICYCVPVAVQVFGSWWKVHRAPDAHLVPEDVRHMWKMSVYWYVFGTALWIIENIWCSYLPSWLELHAIWHLCAGYGTFNTGHFIVGYRAWKAKQKPEIDRYGGFEVTVVINTD
jgi:dihydroceramidase